MDFYIYDGFNRKSKILVVETEFFKLKKSIFISKDSLYIFRGHDRFFSELFLYSLDFVMIKSDRIIFISNDENIDWNKAIANIAYLSYSFFKKYTNYDLVFAEQLLHPHHFKNMGQSIQECIAIDLISSEIEKQMPYVQEHGGDIQVLESNEQHVFLRITGSCVPCGSNLVKVKKKIEEIIDALGYKLNVIFL